MTSVTNFAGNGFGYYSNLLGDSQTASDNYDRYCWTTGPSSSLQVTTGGDHFGAGFITPLTGASSLFRPTEPLIANQFGFAIPAGATINSITVVMRGLLQRDSGGNGMKCYFVDGETGLSDSINRTGYGISSAQSGTLSNYAGSPTYDYYSDDTITWTGDLAYWGSGRGMTLTTARINDSSFGFVTSIIGGTNGAEPGGTQWIKIDSVSMTIDYTVTKTTDVKANDGGTWKTVDPLKVNDAGTWKEPLNVSANDGGTWKKTYGT